MQENNLNSTPETTTPIAVEQPKQSNFLIILLSVLLLISVSISGFFAYQTQKLVNELTALKSQEKIVDTSEPTAEPTAKDLVMAIDPVSGWKIYSRINNFTFNVPSDWSEQPNYSLQSDDKKMSIWIEGDVFGLECLKKYNSKSILVGEVTFKVDYYSGIKNEENCDNDSTNLIFIPIEVNGKRISFAFTYDIKNKTSSEKVFDQILSTFKFLD